MKIAMFVGNHASDTLPVRAGWWITRLVQKGPYGNTTHCEAIHEEYSDGSVLIASASLRDGGVRSKRVWLDASHWNIVDVPSWDVNISVEHLAKTRGMPYDLRGAVATVFIGSPQAGHYFCNHWVGFPFIKASATFGPHQFHAISLSVGQDITDEFFKDRCMGATTT